MILNHDFTLETKKLLEKARLLGVCYKSHSVVTDYMNEKQIYYSDIRYAMKHIEVLAAEKHIVPGLMRYWGTSRDIDRRSLSMVVIVGNYPIIEIEKLLVT